MEVYSLKGTFSVYVGFYPYLFAMMRFLSAILAHLPVNRRNPGIIKMEMGKKAAGMQI